MAVTLVCFAQATLLDIYINRNFLSCSVLSIGSTSAVIFIYFLLFRLFAGMPDCGALFFERYLPRAAYTALAFFPLYLLNSFVARKLI